MPRLPRLLLAGLLLGPAVAGGAAEDEKKSPTNSITANRKELEGLRADHILAPQEKLALPSGLEAPALPALNAPAPAAPVRNQPSADELVPKARSSGWLVDAMEKDEKKEAGGRREDRNSGKGEDFDLNGRKRQNDNDRLQTGDARRGAGIETDATRRTQAGNVDPKTGKAVANPLTSYMANWMTPADFTLLQKPAPTGGSKFLSAMPDFTTPAAVNPSGMLQAFDRAPAGAVEGDQLPSSRPVENPYLQSLTTGPAPTTGSASELTTRPAYEPASLVSHPVPSMLSPPPEPPPPNSKLPESLKRSDDAKYYPQLKRF